MLAPPPQVEITPDSYHTYQDVDHSRGRMPLKHPELLPLDANQPSLGYHAGGPMPMYTQSGGGAFTAYNPHNQHLGNLDSSEFVQFVTKTFAQRLTWIGTFCITNINLEGHLAHT